MLWVGQGSKEDFATPLLAGAVMKSIVTLFVLSLLFVSCSTPSTFISVPTQQASEINVHGFTHIAVGTVKPKDSYAQYGDVIRAKLLEQLTQGSSLALVWGDSISVPATTLLLKAQVMDYSYNNYYSHNDRKVDRTVRERDTGNKWRMVTRRDSVVRDVTLNASFRVSIQFSLENAATQQLVSLRTFSYERCSTTTATNQSPASISISSLEDYALHNVLQQFTNAIRRTVVWNTIELLNDDEIPQLEQGNRFASLGDWANAERMYAEAIRIHPRHESIHKAWYLKGIALQYANKFTEAVSSFNQAILRYDSPLYRNASAGCTQAEARFIALQKKAL